MKKNLIFIIIFYFIFIISSYGAGSGAGAGSTDYYKKAQKTFLDIESKNKKKYLFFYSSKYTKYLEEKIFKTILSKIKK